MNHYILRRFKEGTENLQRSIFILL